MLNDPPGCEKELRDTVTSIFKAHAQQAVEHDLEVVVESMNRRYAWLDKYGRIYRFDHDDLFRSTWCGMTARTHQSSVS